METGTELWAVLPGRSLLAACAETMGAEIALSSRRLWSSKCAKPASKLSLWHRNRPRFRSSRRHRIRPALHRLLHRFLAYMS